MIQAKIYSIFLCKLSALCVVLFFIITQSVFASTLKFSPNFVTFSKQGLIEGDVLDLSVSFKNKYDFDIEGSIFLYHNNEVIGSDIVSVEGGGSVNVDTQWLVSLGEHSFFAEMKDISTTADENNDGFDTIVSRTRYISLKASKSKLFNFLENKGTVGKGVSSVLLFFNSYTQTSLSLFDVFRLSLLEDLNSSFQKIEEKHSNQESGGLKFVMLLHKILLSSLVFVVSKYYLFLISLFVFVIFIFSKFFKKFLRREPF